LAIIGVVAALTIPAVITKVTQDQYVVGLKKAYNTLKSVQREAEQENGPVSNWNWTLGVTDSFNNYFKPHFDILKDCGAVTDNGCFHGLNETKDISGNVSAAHWDTIGWYKFITSDGIAYAYATTSATPDASYPAIFSVDVNGKKGPNMIGRDIFQFNVFKKAGLKPFGVLADHDENIKITTDELNAASGYGCNSKGGEGWYCAAKVLAEGAMNY